MTSTPSALRACGTCGLVQRVRGAPGGFVARCPRCRAIVRHDRIPRAASRAAAFALAALILFPVAMWLPVLSVEQMGHTNSSTIWSGVVALWADGHPGLSLLVLTCSIVIPLGKIGGVFVLCAGGAALRRHHQAAAYQAIDLLGKWGMIDVLLVAFLVALVKLGDLVDVHAGPGAVAFAAVVVLSMLASASFDPSAIWEEDA